MRDNNSELARREEEEILRQLDILSLHSLGSSRGCPKFLIEYRQAWQNAETGGVSGHSAVDLDRQCECRD